MTVCEQRVNQLHSVHAYYDKMLPEALDVIMGEKDTSLFDGIPRSTSLVAQL
jgi:hypothetical protein